jgi:cell division protease FtsH
MSGMHFATEVRDMPQVASQPNPPDRSDSTAPKHTTTSDARAPWRVEGARRPQQTTRWRPPPKRPGLWVLLGLLLALDWFFVLAYQPTTPSRVTVPYSYLVSQIHASNVASVTGQGSTIQGTLRHSVTYPARNGTTSTLFASTRPTFADDNLLGELLREGAVVSAKPISSGSDLLLTILGGVLPTLLLVGFWLWIIKRYWRQMSQGGGMFSMGRSKAHKYEASAQRTTFAEVAGIEEAKDELAEVVDFLKHPDRGCVICSSRAKSDAPSIIFIDELDAIGRSRSSGAMSGSNDEREQTLNQLLTEMDGFTGSEGVIVLAATNRPEILDSALLRAGRFDRRITVNAPDQQGRLKILQVHTQSVPLRDPSDLDAIAASTPGMVGADLRNLVNEAALSAARRGQETVSREDFSSALERITIGAARRIVISSEERRRTAYHESGHALLGMLAPGADPVRKISIIPRGQALGVTYQSPASDRYGYGESYLHGRIIGMLGGRAAELLIYGETTTGPESDLEQATSLVRQMVGRWGMSEEIGAVSALPRSGGDAYGSGAASQHTLELIDEEVKRILSECAEQAKRTLAEHREQLDHLAEALLERETLEEADAYGVAGIPHRSAAGQPVAVQA